MIKNLVFAGGAFYSMAYIGALEHMSKLGYMAGVHRYAGTSSGAMLACLLAAGCPVDQLITFTERLRVKGVLDPKGGIIGEVFSLFWNFGLVEGNIVRDAILAHLEALLGVTNPTFANLPPGVDLVVIGTNLTQCKRVVFSREATPDMSIADAVSISTRIPLIFKPWRSAVGDYLVDGCVSDNFPVDVFDVDGSTNRETLGLIVLGDSSELRPARSLRAHIASLAYALYRAPQCLEASNNQDRTIGIVAPQINNPLIPTAEEARLIYALGRSAAVAFNWERFFAAGA